MTTKQKFNIIAERVNYNEEICGDGYKTELDGKTIRISTDRSLSGVLVKDIAALCSVYCWSFGIYTDKKGNPYIHICA